MERSDPVLSVSRVVALATPIFAALSGYLVTLATKLPGAPRLNQDELTALFIVGSASGLATALKWLHGRAKWEGGVQAIEEARALHAEWGDVENVKDEGPWISARDQEPDITIEELLLRRLDEVAGGLNALAERMDLEPPATSWVSPPVKADHPM